MSDYAAARTHMVDGQLLPNKVLDRQVIDAMSDIPREEFLPKALRSVAYVDEDLKVAEGRYLMEPMVFARMVQEAKIQPEDAVLDIGCLTGYSSAVLSRMANVVMCLEEDEAMAERANKILVEKSADNAVVVTGSLAEGYAAQGPYDVIIIEGCVGAVPQFIIDQLAEGGRLLTVELVDGVGVASMYTCYHGDIGVQRLFDASSPLLPGFEPVTEFQF
ncbi:MAG: protein-L-isoaspartate O-methyltransferase [Alphaproteobacteria bacterium]|nr:MAG: protein-L-isoaspartate O-methyltransferase [Alphaproteobacteria bacterium]